MDYDMALHEEVMQRERKKESESLISYLYNVISYDDIKNTVSAFPKQNVMSLVNRDTGRVLASIGITSKGTRVYSQSPIDGKSICILPAGSGNIEFIIVNYDKPVDDQDCTVMICILRDGKVMEVTTSDAHNSPYINTINEFLPLTMNIVKSDRQNDKTIVVKKQETGDKSMDLFTTKKERETPDKNKSVVFSPFVVPNVNHPNAHLFANSYWSVNEEVIFDFNDLSYRSVKQIYEMNETIENKLKKDEQPVPPQIVYGSSARSAGARTNNRSSIDIPDRGYVSSEDDYDSDESDGPPTDSGTYFYAGLRRIPMNRRVQSAGIQSVALPPVTGRRIQGAGMPPRRSDVVTAGRSDVSVEADGHHFYTDSLADCVPDYNSRRSKGIKKGPSSMMSGVSNTIGNSVNKVLDAGSNLKTNISNAINNTKSQYNDSDSKPEILSAPSGAGASDDSDIEILNKSDGVVPMDESSSGLPPISIETTRSDNNLDEITEKDNIYNTVLTEGESCKSIIKTVYSFHDYDFSKGVQIAIKFIIIIPKMVTTDEKVELTTLVYKDRNILKEKKQIYGNQCFLCLENFDNDTYYVAITKCSHSLCHKACIPRNKIPVHCPYCREPVISIISINNQSLSAM